MIEVIKENRLPIYLWGLFPAAIIIMTVMIVMIVKSKKPGRLSDDDWFGICMSTVVGTAAWPIGVPGAVLVVIGAGVYKLARKWA